MNIKNRLIHKRADAKSSMILRPYFITSRMTIRNLLPGSISSILRSSNRETHPTPIAITSRQNPPASALPENRSWNYYIHKTHETLSKDRAFFMQG
jgi:hypothetical protein